MQDSGKIDVVVMMLEKFVIKKKIERYINSDIYIIESPLFSLVAKSNSTN